MSTADAALRRLGAELTGSEAKDIADRLAAGSSLTDALRVVGPGRRPQVRGWLVECGLGADCRPATVAVLRAVEGARSTAGAITPLWTMPGHVAQGGPLTGSVTHLVDGARHAITCATYNFQRSSGLWDALQRAAARPEMTVRIYLDGRAAEQSGAPGTPTTAEVAAHLSPATVLRTKTFHGAHVRHHAKFLAIDHRFLLVTSANFSLSAEAHNVELGVRMDDQNLAEAVERDMRQAEELLYERVAARPASESKQA